MSRAHALYPNCTRIYTDRTYFKAPYDYTPLLNSFGTVLIRVDDDDYQGDSRILLHKDGRYGFLIFGWGSCSGCDALQDCDSYDDLDALIDQLENEIHWFDSIAAAHTYIIEQDTNGRNFYSHNKPKWKEFVLAVSDIAAKLPSHQAPRDYAALPPSPTHLSRHAVKPRPMSPTPLSTHELLALYYSTPAGNHLEDRLIAFGLAVQAHCLRPTDPTTRVHLQPLNLPQRIYGALRRAGYVYADEVSCLADKQLLCVKDFGPGSLVTLRKALSCVTM